MTITATVNLSGTATQYYAGNTVGFVATFVDSVAGPVNPVDPTFTLTNPYGVQTSYTGSALSNAPAGTFTLGVLLNIVGVWTVRAACSNPSTAAAQTTVNVVRQTYNLPGTIPEPLDQVAGLPAAAALTGAETAVAVQGNNPVQVPLAALSALVTATLSFPFSGTGVAQSGFVVGLDGAVHLAPVATNTPLTYPNVACAALALDLI